ncbi:sulfurtransferase [Streptomyces erythrochromogenes]|uniref:sulfurtransferase n=1 Tax=Streptomyces erythrochromogenes TaxID=285574 RepID=UPI00341E9FD1
MGREEAVVDLYWLQDHLDDPQVVVVEVDEDADAYGRGHIRGAVTFDWRSDLQEQVRRDFVGRDRFEELLSERGIGNTHRIVLYGGNNNWFAAYAYWLLKIYGHRHVCLLDGGRKIWELNLLPLTDEIPQRPRSEYRAAEPNFLIRAFRDEVMESIGQKNLIDVRSPREFTGELLAPTHLPQEQAQRGGHIPTAKNIPWSKAANSDGTFKSDAELRELYEGAGLDLTRDTIAYCRIGERSAHTWFVLHELLGLSNVKNYDGSWTEYGSLVGVPVER